MTDQSSRRIIKLCLVILLALMALLPDPLFEALRVFIGMAIIALLLLMKAVSPDPPRGEAPRRRGRRLRSVKTMSANRATDPRVAPPRPSALHVTLVPRDEVAKPVPRNGRPTI
jgi:hypothetical protein